MTPINTALCSYGMSGFVFHAPFAHVHPGFHLTTVWERSKNVAVKRYPNIKTVRTYEEILNDPSIELVVVNTPSITHYDFTKKALEAGKHVIVEKPFTAYSKEGQELIDLANSKNLKLSVYHNRRFDSDFLTVQKIVKSGKLGKIVDAELRFDRFEPGLSAKAHKEKPTPGVGNLYDLGSHIIDQALVLFGLPKAVFMDADILRPESQVLDYFDIKLFYPDHRVSIRSSYYVKEPNPSFVIHGTKGSFVKSRADIQEASLKEAILPQGDDWGKEPKSEEGILHLDINGDSLREHVPTEQGNYMKYYEMIFDAIRNGKNLPVSAEEGMNVIKVIEAALKSHEEQKVIAL